jgi:hypothetical protein
MISSTSSADRTNPLGVPSGPDSSHSRQTGLRTDQLSTENAAALRAALGREPAVRPEVVARARLLAADPQYPPVAVLHRVSAMILASPDLSEDQS